jgi:hypothetical protein
VWDGAAPALDYDFRADPVLRAVFDYWARQRASRAMPRRRDIEPLELGALLPSSSST